jgi:hypothetical protein
MGRDIDWKLQRKRASGNVRQNYVMMEKVKR